jgi:short-subunit dehydrogenase
VAATNSTAVITGAASGIGQALATALARRGVALAISDVDESGLDETARRCKDHGVDVRTDRIDVADRAGMLAYADDLVGESRRIRFVFNNAGVALSGDAVEHSFEDVDWLLAVNLGGVINGTQAFLPALIDSGDGHLVNISSIFGIIAMPAHSAYNASKFAVRGYTEAVGMELAIARRPVRVHCVHPGGIRTNIANNARTSPSQDHGTLTRLFNESLARTSPDQAAEVILRGVARGKRRILVGADAHALHAMEQLLGSRYQTLVATVAGRVLGGAA